MFKFTKAELAKLTANGAKTAATGEGNHRPVVKLFNPDGAATWLLTDIDPENHDLAFGLCDLGLGSPELGTVYLPELQNHKGRFGIGIERDLHFTATGPIKEYADAAREKGSIDA